MSSSYFVVMKTRAESRRKHAEQTAECEGFSVPECCQKTDLSGTIKTRVCTRPVLFTNPCPCPVLTVKDSS